MSQSILHSQYIIDGIKQSASPFAMLETAKAKPSINEEYNEEKSQNTIIDENIDFVYGESICNQSHIYKYSDLILKHIKQERAISLPHIKSQSRTLVAEALIEQIWKEGSFCLDNLSIDISWDWNSKELGNLATFYQSVEAVCEYIEALDISINKYQCTENQSNQLTIKALLNKQQEVSDTSLTLRQRRLCPENISRDENSWLIYIPFDSSDFRLGASFLSQILKQEQELAPKIDDAAYFIDCYEIVREFVEDKLVVSGIGVGKGGLITALHKILGNNYGLKADISGIMQAYENSNQIEILFSEIPAVIIEVKEDDYEYIDTAMLLQDIAYYPLCSCRKEGNKLRIIAEESNSISKILQSLIHSNASEGED